MDSCPWPCARPRVSGPRSAVPLSRPVQLCRDAGCSHHKPLPRLCLTCQPCAGGAALTKEAVKLGKAGAEKGSAALDQAKAKGKAYQKMKAIEATHKSGAAEKRRASLSVSLVDGAPVGVATGGGMPSMPEGVELKVIDGVPVAVPTEPSAAPPVGIVADDV